MQAVIRFDVGMSTPSTTWPARTSNAHLMVPSRLICWSERPMRFNSNSPSNLARKPLDKLLISSKDPADFVHIHSANCLERKGFSPIATTASFNCSWLNCLMSRRFMWDKDSPLRQRYGFSNGPWSSAARFISDSGASFTINWINSWRTSSRFLTATGTSLPFGSCNTPLR